MKLKGKQRETINLELSPGVTATVAYLTRKDQSEIFTRAYRNSWEAEANEGKGGIVQEFDYAANLQEKLRRQVPAVSGLTAEGLLELAEVPPHVELDVEIVDDCVVWDHDRIAYSETLEVDAPTASQPNRKKTKVIPYTLPAYIYTYAPQDVFARKVDGVQDEFRRLKAEAEKKSSTTSGD
jgi:hypothetical protein